MRRSRVRPPLWTPVPGGGSIPRVPGLPLLGNAVDILRDPAKFFLAAYRTHGPVYRISGPGKTFIVLAGPEAALFMGSRQGRIDLRPPSNYRRLNAEFAATETLVGTEGERHLQLRSLLYPEYSAEAFAADCDELTRMADTSLDKIWRPGLQIPVLDAMQHLVADQIGERLTGLPPLDSIDDLRVFFTEILKVLFVGQRPWLWLRFPKYRKARKRILNLARQMLDAYTDEEKNDGAGTSLIGRILDIHREDPDLMPAENMAINVLMPYLAGLHTMANSVVTAVYAILKDPRIHTRVQAEADALFDGSGVDISRLRAMTAVNGAAAEAIRLWPVAVALPRSAAHDFSFGDHTIPAGTELLIAISVPHFMEEFFPCPDVFDVDRYTEPRSEHLQRGAYSPFGRGAHTCLGRPIADVQMAFIIARLFYRYELSLTTPDYVLETRTNPGPGPSENFRVRVLAERHPAAAHIGGGSSG